MFVNNGGGALPQIQIVHKVKKETILPRSEQDEKCMTIGKKEVLSDSDVPADGEISSIEGEVKPSVHDLQEQSLVAEQEQCRAASVTGDRRMHVELPGRTPAGVVVQEHCLPAVKVEVHSDCDRPFLLRQADDCIVKEEIDIGPTELLSPTTVYVEPGVGKGSRASDIVSGQPHNDCDVQDAEEKWININDIKPHIFNGIKTRCTNEEDLNKYNHKPEAKKQYTCDICQCRFYSKSELGLHVLAHSGREPFTCDICQRQFPRKCNLSKHILAHSGEKSYTCDTCQLEFYSKTELIVHVFGRAGNEPITCDTCQLQFYSISDLIVHLFERVGNEPITCDICQRQFAHECSFIKHLLAHSGGKPCTCDICQCRFSPTSHLVEHLISHRDKNFVCDICQRRFSSKTYLARHLVRHRGQKHHTCDICQHKFLLKSELTLHLFKHSGRNPFSCNICQRGFSCKYTLTRHLLAHSGKKPFTCDICQRQYSSKFSLQRHRPVHLGQASASLRPFVNAINMS